MIRFEHIEFLYGLLLVPVFLIVFLFVRHWKQKALDVLGERELVKRLMPDMSPGRPVWKLVLFSMAFAFLVVALANPQMGSKLEEVKRKGIDIILALDLSNSMLAEDIKPNRLERSKQAISNLIGKLDGDRIGIVVFAGKAYLQLPITSDYSAARMFLSTINTRMIPSQGTAIADAIELAMASFDQNDHSKAIVIITDGETHEGDALNQAKIAAENNIFVYTIGMGLPEGAPIPLYNNSKHQIGYKKDNQNNTVITKLNESMLRQIAAAGKGIYVGASNSNAGLELIFEKINELDESEFESRIFSDFEDRFQYFLAPALVLLLFELLISERKSRWADKFKLFNETASRRLQ